jgi:hypothetical protein
VREPEGEGACVTKRAMYVREQCVRDTPRRRQEGKNMGKTPQDTKPSACVRVCVFICLPPLRPPSLQSLSLSSLSRVPSPTTAFAPRPLPLSPPFLLKTREAPEDFLGQVAQAIVPQIEYMQAREAPEDRLGQVAELIAVQIEPLEV